MFRELQRWRFIRKRPFSCFDSTIKSGPYNHETLFYYGKQDLYWLVFFNFPVGIWKLDLGRGSPDHLPEPPHGDGPEKNNGRAASVVVEPVGAKHVHRILGRLYRGGGKESS